MTAQYWSRKLDGGYVWHGNKYKQIDGLQVRIPDDARPRFEYPEDYLPHIQFNIGDEQVGYDDFETRFPIEEYKKIDGKAVWGEQTLARQWRLIPNRDSYEVGGDATLEQWLNADPFQYDSPERVLHWGEDAIFSPTMMARDVDRSLRRVYLCNRSIIAVRRYPDHVRMDELIRGEVPDVFNLWGPMGTEIPYVWPEGDIEPDQGLMPQSYYHWKKVDHRPAENWEYWVNEDGLIIRFNDANLSFPDLTEVERCLGEGGAWEDNLALQDVRALFEWCCPHKIQPQVAPAEPRLGGPAVRAIPAAPRFRMPRDPGIRLEVGDFIEEDEDEWGEG